MNNLLFIPLAIAYFLVSSLLFLFGLNFMYLTFISLRQGPQKRPKPRPLERWPRVTVQLPIYNEMYVAERLVQAASRLDYPKDRLEIQVLDDSSDETQAIVSQVAKAAQANGIDIKV